MTTLWPSLETFWSAAAVHLWQSTVFLVALAVVARILRNAPAAVQSTLYLAGVLKLLRTSV